jgi:hypothetical protein
MMQKSLSQQSRRPMSQASASRNKLNVMGDAEADTIPGTRKPQIYSKDPIPQRNSFIAKKYEAMHGVAAQGSLNQSVQPPT